MAKVFESGSVRNVVIAGHGGAGKTTLVEAMLFAGGVTKRMGSIEEGTTVCDYHKDEIDRQSQIPLSDDPVELRPRK